MAGTAKTDVLAITMLDSDQAAMPLGQNAKALQQVIVDKIKDATFAATVLYDMLPGGTAKTALGTVLTDLT